MMTAVGEVQAAEMDATQLSLPMNAGPESAEGARAATWL